MISFIRSMFKPSPELVAKVQERAEKEARERGVSIDRISIQATPWGQMRVIVLDKPVDTV